MEVHLSDAQQSLNNFWPKVTEEIKNLTQNDLRQQELPLARIKRIMKLDDDVKMISSEAPALFSKAAEIFITELTLRAWIHTEDNKRRTLQRNDIAMAVTKYDQFDFLIDIVPREEVKPARVKEENRSVLGGLPADQHYFQIAHQHYQAMLQNNNTTATSTSSTTNNQQQTGSSTPQQQTIHIVQTPNGQVQALQTPTSPQHQQPQTQIIQIQNQQQQAQQQQQTQQPQQQQQTQQQQQQAQQQTPPGSVQIIQQIVGTDGQVQQIPIHLTPQHLQMIRMQMSGASQQPIIIQTPVAANQQNAQSAVTSQQQSAAAAQPQIIQLQQGSGGQPVYITQTQQQ